MRAIDEAIAGVSAGWSSHSPPPPEPDAEQPPRPRDSIRAVFGQMLEFLPPDEVVTNLQALRAQEEQILELLDRPAAPELLTETAHTLASAAGMFGFAALSSASRNFQRALTLDAPETDALARQMRDETRAGLATLNELMREDLMHPA